MGPDRRVGGGTQEVGIACVHSVINPENARDPRVTNLMGQEAGLQEKEVEGHGKQFECAVQMGVYDK